MLELTCPYIRDGEYTPDRDLSGIHSVIFDKFETGRIEIPPSLMKDLKSVVIKESHSLSCDDVSVDASVKSSETVTVTLLPLDTDDTTSKTSSVDITTSPTTTSPSILTVVQNMPDWRIVTIVLGVTLGLVVVTAVSVKIFKILRNIRRTRDSDVEEIHYELPSFKCD